jgi:hypothetical protein
MLSKRYTSAVRVTVHLKPADELIEYSQVDVLSERFTSAVRVTVHLKPVFSIGR